MTRRQSLKFGDLVRLILEILRHIITVESHNFMTQYDTMQQLWHRSYFEPMKDIPNVKFSILICSVCEAYWWILAQKDSFVKYIFSFIQYFAPNWPWYSLRGLHIRITWFSLYGIRIPLFSLYWYPYAPTSLYGSTAHCSGYGVAMGCYGLFIVTRTAIVTSQWYDRYCFMEYTRTWARHPTTPWQRECTAITDRQSIDSLLDSMRFVTHFWEITPYILRGTIVVLVQYQCYSINARAFGPRTPYRVGGMAGDVMRAWASHSLVNHCIYTFEASLLSRLLYICTG